MVDISEYFVSNKLNDFVHFYKLVFSDSVSRWEEIYHKPHHYKKEMELYEELLANKEHMEYYKSEGMPPDYYFEKAYKM